MVYMDWLQWGWGRVGWHREKVSEADDGLMSQRKTDIERERERERESETKME